MVLARREAIAVLTHFPQSPSLPGIDICLRGGNCQNVGIGRRIAVELIAEKFLSPSNPLDRQFE
jgi:hypothetical protein